MKNIFIMGNPDSGKTMITLGLALKLKELGYRVGYFKPVDSGRKTPSGKIPGGDAILMKHVLEMDAPAGIISPAKSTPSYLSDEQGGDLITVQEIKSCFDEIAENCDVMLVEGAVYPHVMAAVGLDSVSLARELDSQIITVYRVENDYSLDLAIFNNRFLSQVHSVAGIVFSNVSRLLQSKVEQTYKPVLEQAGFKTLAVIPSRPEIAYPTVGEYKERLGAEVLVGHEYQERLVENVVVGAMTMESALNYLRRSTNKAVVLGGDRSDLALAALETSTSVLVLTGGLYPSVNVLARAGEKEVPVLLTHMDTFSTIEAMGQVARHLKPSDKTGITVARDNIDQYFDWDHLATTLGLEK